MTAITTPTGTHHTAIEWTHFPGYTGATLNPWRGCSHKSAGCRFCYAERTAATRLSGFNPDGDPRPYHGIAEMRDGRPHWTGAIEFHPEVFEIPLRTRKPTAYFVSMSDPFHERVPFGELVRLLHVFQRWCPQHLLLLLTKRHERLAEFNALVEFNAAATQDGGEIRAYRVESDETIVSVARFPLSNVLVGVSVENQEAADARVPALLATRKLWGGVFVSYEPALGPVDFADIAIDDPSEPVTFHNALSGVICIDGREQINGPRLDWVIAGGESGPHARPAHPEWFQSVRDQCAEAGVPFFFKQWGEWGTTGPVAKSQVVLVDRHGRTAEPTMPAMMNAGMREVDHPHVMYRVGKHKAGRLLDGREHNEFPQLEGA